MTVQELIEQLQRIEDKSRIVILQKDSEGNGYSPLAGTDEDGYHAETPSRGETGEDGDPCLVLYPIS